MELFNSARPRHYSDLVFGCPECPGEDAVSVYGPDGHVTFERCLFDFRRCDTSVLDEIIDGVRGAKVTLRGCVLLGGIKAILAGNGDWPEEDARHGEWLLDGCFIWGAGRRMPEAQDGVRVKMRRCWIADWGRVFDVRAFGAWAHGGASIEAEECIFTQSGGRLALGWKNTLIDIANHIGSAFNEDGVRALFRSETYLPGIARGLTGNVRARRCWRNRPWIRIDGCSYFMSREGALDVVAYIEKTSGWKVPESMRSIF